MRALLLISAVVTVYPIGLSSAQTMSGKGLDRASSNSRLESTLNAFIAAQNAANQQLEQRIISLEQRLQSVGCGFR